MSVISNTDQLEPRRPSPDREVVQYDTRTTESAQIVRHEQTVGVWPHDECAQRAWALSAVIQLAGRVFAKDLDTVEQMIGAAEQVVAWVNGEGTHSEGSAS